MHNNKIKVSVNKFIDTNIMKLEWRLFFPFPLSVHCDAKENARLERTERERLHVANVEEN